MSISYENHVSSTPRWGDIGNGFYCNPVLNADFSDPDIIRVEEDFYMVCSDFHYMGMPVLHSKDLVNWSIIGRVYERLDIDWRYNNMEAYGKGSWAPAIRHQNGLFYVYFCTPDEGLYMTSSEKPEGPWAPLHEVKRVQGWEDPCPFWDEDGNAYLGHSTWGAGPIIIHKMSTDGKELLDDGVIVYVGKIAEGTKLYKRNGYYYLIIPEGGVAQGWQAVLRSKNIYGPYERKVVLQQGATNINGPHQGGLVELESGESWFMHFQDVGTLGRVCHLQPVQWIEDWPLMGVEGEPVSIYNKPNVGKIYPICVPKTCDEFNEHNLGLQWQWNHNPVNEKWSLTERPGYLRLKAMKAEDMLHAKNTITQKLIGNSETIITELSIENMKNGQVAGLTYLAGTMENWIGVVKSEAGYSIKAITAGISFNGPKVQCDTVWFKTVLDLLGVTKFFFSVDGSNFMQLGVECKLSAGFWKGARIGLFSFNNTCHNGYADFNWFRYIHEGPS
jgi:beta-xylosidase